MAFYSQGAVNGGHQTAARTGFAMWCIPRGFFLEGGGEANPEGFRNRFRAGSATLLSYFEIADQRATVFPSGR